MNSFDLFEQVSQTIGRVLEDAVFVFTDALSEEDVPKLEGWDARGVELNFTGEHSGKIRMWAGEGFLRLTAANMLGVDEDDADPDQKGTDALKELLNMIVGNVLTDVYGQEPVFNLGLPGVLDPGQLIELDGRRLWVNADGHPVLFVVKMK